MEEKKYNFVAENPSDEEQVFYQTLNIENAYWGRELTEVYKWTVDKGKGMYYTLNSFPGVLEREGITGPDYSNFIYKNIVNIIAYDSNHSYKEKTAYYNVKKIIMDERLRGEKEDFVLAIKEAIIAYEKESNYETEFIEIPDKIVYTKHNLAKWYYEKLKEVDEEN